MRIVASLAAVLVAAGTLLVSAAAPSSPDSLLAFTFGEGKQLLFRVDARTLGPVDGTAVEIPRNAAGRLLSPDRGLLVLADNQRPVLTFVDVAAMKVVRTLQVGEAGSVELVAWPAPDRLLGFGWGCCPVRTDLIVIDPLAGSVVLRQRVAGSGWPHVQIPNGLVYLAAPGNAIRPARVVVTDVEGRSRSVVLNRIRAGTKRRTVRGSLFVEVRWPGLAADPTGRTAYVVAPGKLVAEVDLETLGVTYHTVTSAGTRRLARAQKSVNGPMRYAQWLGNGRIAVSGTDARITVSKTGDQKETWTPVGVSVIDTTTWRFRMLDPTAGAFSRVTGGLIVYGPQSFTAYDLDGRPRFDVPLEEPLAHVQAVGQYAYAWGRVRTTTIVDLASGSVVARIPKPDLWLVGVES